MIPADEIQNRPGPVMLVETAQMPLDSTLAAVERPRSGRRGELMLTGSQVLAGCVAALCTVGLLLWAVTKLCLFEP